MPRQVLQKTILGCVRPFLTIDLPRTSVDASPKVAHERGGVTTLFCRGDRFRNWGRKRRWVEITARPVRTDRSRSKSEMVLVDVVFAACVFLKLFVRFA